ncbi:hypothetical protein [Caulobacter sp. 17J65-9]|uniref:hypothetical protein n=1 Tax=Caulobacter sp. 17J65-9 TaxID=2709382 RepID=UPI0013C7519B|nr:hypothetical protein [Caulobacter sp. 17J65-9]NEX95098.1 hypothetical protein [Caulobacter sp. 17J65-9]
MRAIQLVGGTLAALALAGAAQACTTIAPSAVIEFAEGSAELDAVDREELAAFLGQARAISPMPWLKLRTFADRPGSRDAATWTAQDKALATARQRSITDAVMLMGGTLPDPTVVGVAPDGAETRTGADGVARSGRALIEVELPPQPPRKDDGLPVPTC